ncbi:MAG: hypothetical protein Q8N98_03930, partial [bacterium]|nr:hypothetical protein [bacterium]
LLKEDLLYLFEDRTRIENWLKNWRESYLRLLDEYKIHTVTTLENVLIKHDFYTDNFSFAYGYHTEDGRSVQIIYTMSDYWIDFRDGDILVPIENKISDFVQFTDNDISNLPASQQKKLKQYATVFYHKTEAYFKKTNRIILGDNIITKVIRITTDNLNQKEQIVLNKSALLSCELDDLLK